MTSKTKLLRMKLILNIDSHGEHIYISHFMSSGRHVNARIIIFTAEAQHVVHIVLCHKCVQSLTIYEALL